MSYKTITFEVKDRTAGIILNRPEEHNAVNRERADEISSCCEKIDHDEGIHAVILTGSGGNFSSGEQPPDVMTSGLASSAIASIRCPVVAAIEGEAIGAGLEMALACDLRLSTEDASFGFTEVTRGRIPSGGGTQRLPRIAGRAKALEMILTAVRIDAHEAWRIGLVNRILPASELYPVVEDLARLIASKGPIAARYAKEAIAEGADLTLRQGLRLEADLSFLLQSTRDRTEGISAFLAKRVPEFKGE